MARMETAFVMLLLPLSVQGNTPSPAAVEAPTTSTSSEENVGVAVLTFFVIALVIGVATYHVLAITRIPYTALLIVWGVILGIANETYDRNWKLLGSGTQAWQSINPSLLLTAFLPILLFAAAFGLEWQYIRRLIGSGLLLAGPGVLFGASITAVLVKYSFPYDWTWVECLLFGAIFSATDPVAVVAVLKETGMPKKLRTLVDLEALLNDGTAYVLFILLRGWAEEKHQSVSDAFRLFFRLSAGGPATGIAFGLAVTLWLRYMYNKPLAEISLTIAAAYGTFIVADQLFGVSSVLAVVFLGLWMAAKGFNHISRKVEHPLHLIWEELEYIANTVVFILSGVVIAGRIYESANGGGNLIQGQDWGYALLLWVYLTVIRIAMFILSWPLLNAWGYVISPKEAVVLCWSGLRGAVGLSLALFILLDSQIADKRFRTLTFFHMGCVSFLTIIVQGTSMKPLLQSMKLTKPSSMKRNFLGHVLKQVEEHGEEQLRFAKYDRVLGDPDWQKVQSYADLEPHTMMKRYASKLGSMTASSLDVDARMAQLALKMNRGLLIKEKRSRLLLAVRQTYNDFFQDHYVSTNQVTRLRLSADQALDHLGQALCDWGHLRSACNVPFLVSFAQRWTKHDNFMSEYARRTLALSLENAAILALAFCHSHQLAVQDMIQYEKLEEWSQEESPANCTGLPLDNALEDMKHNVSEQILMESKAEVEEAYQFIADLRDAFPEVLKGIKTAQLAQEMLIYKEEYINEIGCTGLMEETELEQMLDLVEFKLSRLHFHPPRFQWPSITKMLLEHPMFEDLPDETFKQEVLQHVQIRFYGEGKTLYGIGNRAMFATVILRGKARLESPALYKESCNSTLSGDGRMAAQSKFSERGVVASAGAVLGCWPVLLQTSCPFNIVTSSICMVAKVPQEVLQRLMRKHRDVQAIAWQSAGAALALLHGGPQLAQYDYNALVKIFRYARVESKEAGEQVRVAGSAMLATGCLRRLQKAQDGQETLLPLEEGPCLLSSEPAVYTCLSHAKVLHLPGSLDLAVDKTGKTFSKSALAELVKPHSRLAEGDVQAFSLSRLSVPSLKRANDFEAGIEAGRPQIQQLSTAFSSVSSAALQMSEAEVSLSNNRRKSLAHGLLIQGLASKPSAGSQSQKPSSDVNSVPHDHARTLSGATGAMLLREWQAYRQQHPQQSTALSPVRMRSQGSGELRGGLPYMRSSPSPLPADSLPQGASPASGVPQAGSVGDGIASAVNRCARPRVTFAGPEADELPVLSAEQASKRLAAKSAPARSTLPTDRGTAGIRPFRDQAAPAIMEIPGDSVPGAAIHGRQQSSSEGQTVSNSRAQHPVVGPNKERHVSMRPPQDRRSGEEEILAAASAGDRGQRNMQEAIPEDLPLRRQVLRSVSRVSGLMGGRPSLRRKSFLAGLSPLEQDNESDQQLPEK